MVTIRPATLSDAPGIARVQVETWRFAYVGIVPQAFLDAFEVNEQALRWESVLLDGSHVFVAENADGVCGFISGGALRDGIDVAAQNYDAEIYALYVAPAAQGRGAGRQLMRAMAEHLIADGLIRPVVWALEENPWCAFYKRLGGRSVAQKMIEIGGKQLSDIAYGWDDVGLLLR
jgi:ribosomal protein S18 acetylase RimI-like enzyme